MNLPFGPACLAEYGDVEHGRRRVPDEEAEPHGVLDIPSIARASSWKRCTARIQEKGNRPRTDPRPCRRRATCLGPWRFISRYTVSSKGVVVDLRRGSDRLVRQVRILIHTFLKLIPHDRINSAKELSDDCQLIENADAHTRILADTTSEFLFPFSSILLHSLEISECLRQYGRNGLGQ